MNFKKMKELRLSKGMTQEELALRTCKTQVTICRIESGEIEPSLRLLRTIAYALGCKAADLIDE